MCANKALWLVNSTSLLVDILPPLKYLSNKTKREADASLFYCNNYALSQISTIVFGLVIKPLPELNLNLSYTKIV